jgi:hypothetical protein
LVHIDAATLSALLIMVGALLRATSGYGIWTGVS